MEPPCTVHGGTHGSHCLVISNNNTNVSNWIVGVNWFCDYNMCVTSPYGLDNQELLKFSIIFQGSTLTVAN